MIVTFLVITIFSLCEPTESARILGVVPTPSFSHQIVFRPIWRELSRRGHDVVVITTDPQNDPDLNITEIDVSSAYDLWTKKHNVIKLFNEHKYNIFKLYSGIIDAFMDIITQELLHPEVQSMLKNESEHFDLAIIEYLLPPMFGFSERFNCPYIGVVTLELPNAFHGVLGNPSDPISENNPVTRRLLEEQFGKDVPPLTEIMKNVSMVLINENPAFNTRPLGPAFVLFGGGAHLTQLQPLPKELKEYLDGAEEGFIYFSLGTNVKSDVFLPEMRKVVLDAFRELPYKVLWKFDVSDIPDIPENVKISNWVPQQDILRHPNIKVFITQGGLQSTEEAIFSHVPIVGIPYVADQVGNVKKLVAKGGGVFLDKDSFTTESLKEALLEVIKNPRYKESITEIADLSRDQPMTGLEKAIWWTEYVIRHKGAPHLRNPAMDVPAYQYYFLDIIAFLTALLLVFFFICYKLIVFSKNVFVRIFKSTKIKLQ